MIQFFTAKDPEEVIVLSVDFAPALDAGETILTASWTITNEATPTEDTAGMLSGATDTSGKPVIRQKVQGGTNGATYIHRVKVTTSAGRTLVHGVRQNVSLGA